MIIYVILEILVVFLYFITFILELQISGLIIDLLVLVLHILI